MFFIGGLLRLSESFLFALIVMFVSAMPLVIYIITPLPPYEIKADYPLFMHENKVMAIVQDQNRDVILNLNQKFNRNVDPEKYVLRKYISSGRVGVIKWDTRLSYELKKIENKEE
jgi:hypothetical protein